MTEEDKVLKGVEHKLNVIIRSYKRFDSEAFRKDQPEVYNDYKTKVVSVNGTETVIRRRARI